MPKLKQIDKNLYEAAIDLGCNPSQAFLKVILPEIIPSVVSGFMMSFTMSISDFVISYFTSGNVQTLPIIICAMTRKLVSPEINALFTILFAVILVLLISVNFGKTNKNSGMMRQR
jgi:spermidine/putrescine transport system permease protein